MVAVDLASTVGVKLAFAGSKLLAVDRVFLVAVKVALLGAC